MKLSEALKQYTAYGQYKNKETTLKTYEKHIRHLVLYFKNCDIETVTLKDLIDYLEAMRELGWDNNALSQKLCAYKQFFRFFHSQSVVVFNPEMIPIPRLEHNFPKIIGECDYKKLIKALPKDRRAVRCSSILRLLWDTGIRLNELRSLDLADIDLVNKRAIIKTEKSRGIKPSRMIFWTEETNKALKVYIDFRAEVLKNNNLKSDALYISMWGKWKAGERMSQTAIEQMMAHLSHRANLGYIANPHRFRHRFGRNLALQGANNSVISDMMGHSDLNSTRIYTVMNESMMQETYKKYFK